MVFDEKIIPAIDFGHIILISSTFGTQIRIAFPHSQKAWTLFSITLGFTSASRKPVLTVRTALTKLFTKIRALNAITIGVTFVTLVTRNVIVNHISTGISSFLLLSFSAMVQPLGVFFLLFLFGWSIFTHTFRQCHIYKKKKIIFSLKFRKIRKKIQIRNFFVKKKS